MPYLPRTPLLYIGTIDTEFTVLKAAVTLMAIASYVLEIFSPIVLCFSIVAPSTMFDPTFHVGPITVTPSAMFATCSGSCFG